MKVIIAGSRTIKDYSLVCEAITESGFEIDLVVSGHAKGVDQLGERWAKEHGVPVEQHPAQWNAHGIAAGPIRNEAMAQAADALVAIMPEEGTKGTKDMIRRAKKHGLKVHILYV